MHPLVRAAAAVLGMVPFVAAASTGSASLCDQLARHVRESAAVGWQSAVAMKSWVQLARSNAADTHGPRAIAAQGVLRSALAVSPAAFFSIERLPGTPIFMGYVVEGTLHCQYAKFAQVDADGTAHLLPNPEGYAGPCWNVQGDLGTVLGHPAYIESGNLSQTTEDTQTRVWPWMGKGWGRACAVQARLNYTFQLARQFCGDQAVCHAARAIAVDVARSYRQYLHLPEPPMRAVDPRNKVPDFTYPPNGVVTTAATAAVDRAWRLLARMEQAAYPGGGSDYTTVASVFPTFGDHGDNPGWNYSYSYDAFALFPVTLDGHTYLGAMGHNGVGWRAGLHTLFAVYALPTEGQHDLVPLAGLVIDRVPTGLKGMAVLTGQAALPRAH
jgi:hypothetical protein